MPLLLAALLAVLPGSASALTLDEAWAAADAGSVDLKLVHEQRLQSDTLRTQALALLSPKLVLGADYTINQREVALDFSSMIPEEFADLIEAGDPIVVNKKQYLSWNASVVQPLFNGQALPLYVGAVETVKAGRETEEALRAQIRLGVAQAYWGVLLAREGERVAAQAVENARKHMELANTGVAVGTAAPQVKLQAELGVARAERQHAVAREGVVRAQEAFARLTGLPADARLDAPPLRTLPYQDAGQAAERALSGRPDIAAARHQAKAGQMQATASHLAWLPSVDGRFTEAYTENSGFSGEPYNWQLVFTANWVLWDGGARLAAEANAASVRRMASYNVTSMEQKATEEVRSLWQEHERAVVATEAVKKELALAEENLRLADVAFAAGTISYMEVEDARLGLAASRMTALTEAMNADLAALRLLAATGDL